MIIRPRGFTLIELLVVIAIIGILSSVVLSSLNTARERSRISAIKSQVTQFRNLMELEYSETGSYANLNKLWAGTSSSCAARAYAGANAAKALEICNALRSLISNQSTTDVFTGANTASGFSMSNDYSIMARLPNGFYFCMGSSGQSSDTGTASNGWTSPGCYSNP